MSHQNPIRFYFFLRSPYVWLAAEQLMRDGIDVDPIPLVGFAEGTVFGDPAANPPRLAYLIEDVARLAERMDLTLAPPVDVENWELVHNVAELARRNGKGLAFAQMAGRARWTRSLSLEDPEVIADVAGDVGLDAQEAQAAMTDAQIRADMVATYRPLIEKDQVFGVPFFAFDAGDKTHRYWGQDRIGMMVADARAMGVL
ncbi:MAG: DsbA family protein [Pseudomonadota bacterium]